MESIKQIEIRATRMEVREHCGAYATAVRTSQDAERVCRTFFSDLDSERFLVVMFDARQKPMGFIEVARGAAEVCPVDVREVFRAAVLMNASSVVISHNHPSGDPMPSAHDIELTLRLVQASRLLGIAILDHLIIGGDMALSMASLGLMPR
jgi:DNA repair protein RadC